MATPNYSYEKRQRELAKKRKAEEKRQKKLNRTDDSSTGEAPLTGSETEDSGVAPPPPGTGSSE